MAIPRDLKPRRSAHPQDLRDAGPGGDVQRYWEPEAFQWYQNGQAKTRRDELCIKLTPYQLRISAAAVEAAALQTEDRIEIGVNKTFLAVRKNADGIRVRTEKKTTRAAYIISAKKLIDKLASEGWPVPCHMVCTWDERNKMLVAQRPQGGGS